MMRGMKPITFTVPAEMANQDVHAVTPVPASYNTPEDTAVKLLFTVSPFADVDATPTTQFRAKLTAVGGDRFTIHAGVRLAYVPLTRRGGVSMRLLRGAPGTDVGRHGHKGMEYTLVLAGGFTDVTGSYGPGDFQTASPDLRHNPIADGDDSDCINLAVTTAPLRFESVVQKIVGKLFGF